MPLPLAAGLGIAQTGLGLVQSIFGGGAARKAQKQMEQMVNSYKPNQSILDYYNKAVQRYNVDPYGSAMYRNQMQNVNRNVATGIGAAQDRRSGMAAISNLTQGANDASLRAVAGAEQQQAQALGQLGQATAMKAQEDFKPFEMKYNLLSMKAGGGNQIMNAGISNVFNGLGNVSNMLTAGGGSNDDYYYATQGRTRSVSNQ
jgi:hypothetical protein